MVRLVVLLFMKRPISMAPAKAIGHIWPGDLHDMQKFIYDLRSGRGFRIHIIVIAKPAVIPVMVNIDGYRGILQDLAHLFGNPALIRTVQVYGCESVPLGNNRGSDVFPMGEIMIYGRHWILQYHFHLLPKFCRAQCKPSMEPMQSPSGMACPVSIR